MRVFGNVIGGGALFTSHIKLRNVLINSPNPKSIYDSPHNNGNNFKLAFSLPLCRMIEIPLIILMNDLGGRLKVY